MGTDRSMAWLATVVLTLLLLLAYALSAGPVIAFYGMCPVPIDSAWFMWVYRPLFWTVCLSDTTREWFNAYLDLCAGDYWTAGN
jgi:hypothetical protein